MTKFHYFAGKAKWAKVFKGDGDDKYESWKINLYLTPDSWEEFKASGIQLQQRFDEEGSFVTFRRRYNQIINKELVQFEPPKVVDADGNETTAKIGNGSDVVVKVATFETRKGPGHRLEAVKVTNLVQYDKPALVIDGVEIAPF